MYILRFILIVSGMLVATYFSGPKNSPEQFNSPPQGQVQALPSNSPSSNNKEATVTIRNKTTGEFKQVPKSQVESYVSTPQPKVVNPSDKALKLSVYVFLGSNEKQRSDLINKFSNGTNDPKEAIKKLALLLDSNPEAMALTEKAVAQDIANKKSQSDSQAILEYHEKEYARLKAEFDSIPVSNTYIGGVQNTNTSPPKLGTTQKNDPYVGSSLANESSKHKGPTTYNVIGNTVYGSDGSTYNQIGNTIYKNDGTTYSPIGNTLYGSDGSSYSNIGNTTYSNDGTSYNRIGNTVYGSDGSTATSIGNTLYTYPGY